MREADNHASSVRPTRTRRTGSLLGRLRQLREPAARPLLREDGLPTSHPGAGEQSEFSPGSEYDFLETSPGESSSQGSADNLYIGSVEAGELPEDPWDPEPRGASEDALALEDHSFQSPSSPHIRQTPATQRNVTNGDLKVERALAVFNAGEQPRRVAGVARSLGAPTVTVRPLEESGGTVAIVVAWELCWYRYEVDLGDEAAGSKLVAQGLELDELPDIDRLANASADDRGALAALLV
jgi:hypothetical protein